MRNSLYLMVVAGIVFFSCDNNKEDKLTIATASNMQFVMRELTESFSKKTKIQCEIIVGSSGKLSAQIKQGAPFDLFVSANMKYPEDLYISGFTRKKPTIYAYGKLVLWTMSRSANLSLSFLTSDKVKHIAVANPRIAPYGIPAIEVLKNEGIYDLVKEKLVYGESISQTNQFITSEVAEVGFTAKSVVLSPNMKENDNWIEMNIISYTPIAQGVVILNNRIDHFDDAQEFCNFLLSSRGGQILYKYGYALNNDKNLVYK
jgi:molybdate transport system substrate-binding protein